MFTPTIRITVDRVAAIMAGYDTFGEVDLPVTPSQLTPELRATYVNLPVLPCHDHISVLPDLGRPIASASDIDVPALLEELRTKLLAEDAERTTCLRTKYDAVRQRLLQRPVMPDLSTVVIHDDAVELPQRTKYLAHFLEQEMTADQPSAPRAVAKSLDDHALKVAKAAMGLQNWKDSDVAKVRGWLEADAEVRARVDEALAGAVHLTVHVAKLHQALRQDADARAAAKKAEEAAALRRREEQLAKWVSRYGTPDQKKRQAEKLLPEDEVVAAIREQAFSPLEDLPRYERITKKELAAAAREAGRADLVGSKVEFVVLPSKTATKAQFAVKEAILAKLPEAEVVLRDHLAYYDAASDELDPEVLRKSAYVKLRIGELRLSREYAVD